MMHGNNLYQHGFYFCDNFDEDEYQDLRQLAATYAEVHKQRQPRVFHDCSNPSSEDDDDDFHVRYRLMHENHRIP